MRNTIITRTNQNTQAEQQWRNWQALKEQRDERERRAVEENAKWGAQYNLSEVELRGMFA